MAQFNALYAILLSVFLGSTTMAQVNGPTLPATTDPLPQDNFARVEVAFANLSPAELQAKIARMLAYGSRAKGLLDAYIDHVEHFVGPPSPPAPIEDGDVSNLDRLREIRGRLCEASLWVTPSGEDEAVDDALGLQGETWCGETDDGAALATLVHESVHLIHGGAWQGNYVSWSLSPPPLLCLIDFFVKEIRAIEVEKAVGALSWSEGDINSDEACDWFYETRESVQTYYTAIDNHMLSYAQSLSDGESVVFLTYMSSLQARLSEMYDGISVCITEACE